MHRRQLLEAAAALAVTYSVGGSPRAARADPALAPGTQASVTTDGLHVRGGPGSDEPTLGALSLDTTVDLLASSADGAWWRVAAGSLIGYASADYLQPTGQSASQDILDVDLTFGYSPQLTDVWCDPADLEMWLHYREGDASGASRSLQSALWDWETTHNAGFTVDQWDCSPFAVASAAHQWMPGVGFDHFMYDDAVTGSRVLAWLLANAAYREPSIALIWRGLHYVLVRGVRSMGDPVSDPDAQVLGFYVADPDRNAPFWLGTDRFVPIDRWLNELFTPVSYLTPHTGVPGDTWQGRMVAIQRSPSLSGPSLPGHSDATPASYA